MTAKLLKLSRNKRRASSDVKRIALAHAVNLDRRIEAMQSMNARSSARNAVRAITGPTVPLWINWPNSGDSPAVSAPPNALFSDRDSDCLGVRSVASHPYFAAPTFN
jgi:hypothetical protein